MSTTEPGDGRHSDMETKMTNPAPTTEPGDGRHSDMETKMTNPAPTTEPGDGRHSDMETKMTNPAPTTEPGDGRHSDMETKMTNPAPTTEPGDGPHSDISNPTLPGTSINWDNISYRELKAMARSCSITIPPGLNKNLLKTFVKADKEGHNEYLRLLVNEVLAKQSRLKKRLREKRSNKPVVKIVKNKVQAYRMKKATKAQKQPILDPIVGGLLQSSGGTSVHLCHSEQHKLKSCKVVLHRLKEFQNADHRPVPPMIEREVIVDESLRHLSPIELLEHIHNKVSQEGMVYDEKTSASESGSDKVADLGEFYEANMSPTELNENIDTDNYQVGPPMENPEVDIDDISINQLDFLRSKDYLPIIPDPQMTSSCIRPVGDLNTESVKDCVENINKNMKELDLLTNLIKIAFNLDSEEDPRACKYGCPMLFDEKIKQEEHEAHCMSQPFECPFLDCVWFEKLERLVTHIYDTHNQVVLNADTTFTINFDSELSCDAGPSNSKLTAIFLQLFKDRLAVISVIGNFQTMQVFIYIQYVNDNYHCHSTATLQVSHPDGMFHQWSGRIQPLTVNPETLIAEESCIVFNTTADQMAAGLFSLRSKISIQEHSLPL